MACLEQYGSPNGFAEFWCLAPLSEDQDSEVRSLLKRSSVIVNQNIRAVGACDCTFNADAGEFLATINYMLAASIYNCRCVQAVTTVEHRQHWMRQARDFLGQILQGDIELCDGHTGRTYPAFATAERGLTAANRARIIANRIQRTGS